MLGVGMVRMLWVGVGWGVGGYYVVYCGKVILMCLIGRGVFALDIVE